MRNQDLLRFIGRDWKLLEQAKSAHWAALKRQSGLGAGIAAGEELRRFARMRHPRWPSRRDRLQDIQTHRRVSTALKSVGRARTS